MSARLEAPTIAALRVKFVKIVGASMVPTVRHGDLVLVREGGQVAPGHVVLARFRALPDRLVVKRAAHAADGGWWLASDNAFAGGDSTVHGVADVHGRVVLRLRHGLPSRVR